MTNNRLLPILAVAAALSLSTRAADVFTPGFLKREFFAGANRPDVESGAVTTPTSTSAVGTFESPTNVADNYAQRISGFFVPATTDDYVFFIASDDDGDLFLSTDDKPANKKLIAQEAGWSAARRWVRTQRSSHGRVGERYSG